MRTFSAAALAALTDSAVRPFYLLSVELASTTLYMSTLDHNITWNSHTWEGEGLFLDLGSLTESAGSAEGFEVEFAGEPSALLSIHLQEVQQNKPALVYLGFLDGARALVADPILLFSGKVSHSKLVDAADSASLVLSIESVLADFDRPKDLRYNHEAQQVKYPGDLFFEYVEQLQEASYFWGLKSKKNKKKKKVSR